MAGGWAKRQKIDGVGLGTRDASRGSCGLSVAVPGSPMTLETPSKPSRESFHVFISH